MLSSIGKIRLTLVIVASISLGTSFVSLWYASNMAQKIQVMAQKDAKLAQLAEDMSIKMLEARREEKNFVIYIDSTFIRKNKQAMEQIRADVDEARGISLEHSAEFDSLELFVAIYSGKIDLLVKVLQEDPKALRALQKQMAAYEKQLRQIAKEGGESGLDSLPSWMSDLNISIFSAATRLSAEQARLFAELSETSSLILKLTQGIATSARESLASHGSEGVRYAVKAQRNTVTIFIITGILLIYLVFYLPSHVFLPFRRIIRALHRMEKGEIRAAFPGSERHDEVGELSRAFTNAVDKLRLYDQLKTKKIVESERRLHRLLEELQEAVLLFSSDLTLSFANTEARRAFSLSEDAFGRNIRELAQAWDVLGVHLENIETSGRVEFTMTVSKDHPALMKRRVAIVPSLGGDGRVETIFVVAI